MWRAQLGEEHAYELSDWEKSFSGEPQSEYNAARYFGCKDDRRHAAHFPRHARNSTEKVSLFEVSQRIVEAAKRKRSSQESPKALCPKWTCISPFCLFSVAHQPVDRWLDSAHLSQSRSDSHSRRSRAAERSADPHSAEQVRSDEARLPHSRAKKADRGGDPESSPPLRFSIFFSQVTRRWESKTTGPRL